MGDKEEASRMSRMKKGLASALLDTAAGRQAAVSLIGTEGATILEAVKSIMEKDVGHDDAKEKKKDILKIATKVKVMIDEKKLSQSALTDALPTFQKLTACFMDFLSPDSRRSDTTELQSALSASQTLCFDLFSPHMKEKNAQKIIDFFAYFNNPTLLAKIYSDKSMIEEKKTIFENLESILQSNPNFAAHVSAVTQKLATCSTIGCRKPRMVAEAKFSGSDLCLYHHYHKYTKQIDSPHVDAWLYDDALISLIQPLWDAQGKSEAVQFIHEVAKFRATQKKELRRSRAPVIFSKFLEPNLVGAEEKTITALASQIAEAKDGIAGTIFNKAQEEVLIGLEITFVEKFLTSAAYKEWVVKRTLPADKLERIAEASKLAQAVSS